MTRERRWRWRWLGFLTLSGLARRGYFIPYRYAGRREPQRAPTAYPFVDSLFRGERHRLASGLELVETWGSELADLETGAPGAPRWSQQWFPRLDAAIAYAMVRGRHPRRIVEIGSGHSTRFLARAVMDAGLGTAITAIDPAPRAALAGLPVTVIRKLAQEAAEEVCRPLEAGDFLFVDSSHILMPGSDVDFVIARLLPALPAGAVVHFHDVFLPDDYPEEWSWRGYNEQSALAALLTGGGWQVLFASHYAATRMKDSLSGSAVARLPLAEGARESSLWLEKTDAALTAI